MQRLIAVLDGFSEWTGRAVAWLTLAMVLVTGLASCSSRSRTSSSETSGSSVRTPSFEIIEGELTGVESIDFVGNQIYSDRRLRGVIETTSFCPVAPTTL